MIAKLLPPIKRAIAAYTDPGAMGHARSPKWAGVRAKHLKLFPTCAACGGNVKLEVHHILPFHLHPELELSEDNLITLCEGPLAHHFGLGHFGNWKKFNLTVRSDAAYLLVSFSRERAA